MGVIRSIMYWCKFWKGELLSVRISLLKVLKYQRLFLESYLSRHESQHIIIKPFINHTHLLEQGVVVT